MKENKIINGLIAAGMLTFWTVFAPFFSYFVIYLGVTYIKMHGIYIFSGSILLLSGIIYGIIYILYIIQFIVVSWKQHKANKENKINKEKEEENK